MNLLIVKIPNKILFNKTEDINLFTGFYNVLASNMLKWLHKKNTGYAITANQVGHSFSLFVLNDNSIEIMEEMNKYRIDSPYIINPKFISKSETLIDSKEGCLSIPNCRYKVKRHEEIEVSYQTANNEIKIVKLTGLLSRIFQHEIDHLNGITIEQIAVEKL